MDSYPESCRCISAGAGKSLGLCGMPLYVLESGDALASSYRSISWKLWYAVSEAARSDREPEARDGEREDMAVGETRKGEAGGAFGMPTDRSAEAKNGRIANGLYFIDESRPA